MAPKSSNTKQTPTTQQQHPIKSDFDFGFLQSGFLLYHREESGRQLQIQIADSKQVDKPAFANTKHLSTNFALDTQEQIPCDIVGLDSKKSKKPVKIRFHPEALKMAKRNESVAKGIYAAVRKMIDEFLGQEWTMDPPAISELPKYDIESLRRCMLDERIQMNFNENSTDLHWRISNPPKFLLPAGLSAKNAKKSKKGPTPMTIANSAPAIRFELHVQPRKHSEGSKPTLRELNTESHAHESQSETNCQQQRVELRLTSGHSFVHTIFALDFQSYYPLLVADSGQENGHFAEFAHDLNLLHIHLCHSAPRSQEFFGQSAVSISGCGKKMIDCAQIRLEKLRHHFRQNHHQQQQQQNGQSQPPVLNEAGPILSAFHNPSARVVLFQLTNSRQLPMSRFTVVPVSNNNAPVNKLPPHHHEPSAPNRMLHVRVHSSSSEDYKNGSAKSPSADQQTLSGSPADSLDSGVAGSPVYLHSTTTDEDDEEEDDAIDTLSPLPEAAKNRFHFNATAHHTSASASQPQFRSRSVSECWDTRQPATSPLAWATPTTANNNLGGSSASSLSPSGGGTPLRSILKKPKIVPPGLGNTLIVGQQAGSANGLRRVPTRYVLARSISECQDDSAAAAAIMAGGFELGSGDEVVSMEDLATSAAAGSPPPLSVCAEVDEEEQAESDESSGDEPQRPTAEQQRKKRVSFNEQVQARIYRSNSSILACRNKQERRMRNRQRRRAESESTDCSISAQDQELFYGGPTLPLNKLSAEEKLEDDENDPTQSQMHEQQEGRRRDSGFDYADSGVDSPQEESMQVESGGSPKRVQRVISSDSAFGDEEIEIDH